VTSPNRILSTLPAEKQAELARRYATERFFSNKTLSESGEVLEHVHFPYSGIVSLIAEASSGMTVETGMIGADGAVNAGSALDSKISLVRAIVQVEGQGIRLRAEEVRQLAERHPAFRSAIARHQQMLLAEAQRSAVCFAAHRVDQRMCRWLLRVHDLVGSCKFNLTQEFLAQMLGVQRTSVSLVAGTLQQEGLIRYSRGNIEITDDKRLRESACECYAFLHEQRSAITF
jgi:CRP-like cAMP-binding protein